MNVQCSLCVQVLSCGDNVMFAGLVAPEGEESDFPAALMDPGTLATIVNFRWVDADAE